MHHLLFENQHALSYPSLVSCAEMLELDVRRFTRDLEERRFAAMTARTAPMRCSRR